MKAHLLPVEQWGRAEAIDGMPIGDLGRLTLPGDMRVAVVEDDGRIVARCLAARFAHFEGLWIDPEHKNAFRPLLRVLYGQSQQWAKATMVGASDDRMKDILCRMGAVTVPAQFYVLNTEA